MEAVVSGGDGATSAGWPPDPARWMERLVAVWNDQRGEAALPDADELFLADMAELIPHLVLASRDDGTDDFRIDFAGAAARSLLELEPVGEVPERCPQGHPLAWLGTGFAQVRRPAIPGLIWMREQGRLGLFLPYGGFDGRVTLILAGIAAWPAEDRGAVVPLLPGGGGAGGGGAGGGGHG